MASYAEWKRVIAMMRMRTGVAVAALMLSAGTGWGSAQEPQAPVTTPSQPAENQASLPMEARTGRAAGAQGLQVEALTRQLGLTPDQVRKLKSIDADTAQQLMAVRNDAVSSREEKRPRLMAIRDGQQARVRAMLTEEQKPKYEALLAKMQERRRDGAGSGAPPQP